MTNSIRHFLQLFSFDSVTVAVTEGRRQLIEKDRLLRSNTVYREVLHSRRHDSFLLTQYCIWRPLIYAAVCRKIKDYRVNTVPCLFTWLYGAFDSFELQLQLPHTLIFITIIHYNTWQTLMSWLHYIFTQWTWKFLESKLDALIGFAIVSDKIFYLFVYFKRIPKILIGRDLHI